MNAHRGTLHYLVLDILNCHPVGCCRVILTESHYDNLSIGGLPPHLWWKSNNAEGMTLEFLNPPEAPEHELRSCHFTLT